MSIALKISLDESLAKLDEQKDFCKKRLAIQEDGHDGEVKVLEESCKEKEAALKAALVAEQERAQQAAKETADEQSMHALWAAGGAVGGLLLGAIVGGGLVLYFTLGQ
jgi:hypothetical protein